MLLVIFVFGMFGAFQCVNTYEVANVSDAKAIVSAKIIRVSGAFAGEPPSSIPKLYKTQYTERGKVLVDITEQLGE